MQHNTEPFISIRGAAAALDVHERALARAIKRGIVPAYRPFGRRIYVLQSEVIAAIAAAKIGGAE